MCTSRALPPMYLYSLFYFILYVTLIRNTNLKTLVILAQELYIIITTIIHTDIHLYRQFINNLHNH